MTQETIFLENKNDNRANVLLLDKVNCNHKVFKNITVASSCSVSFFYIFIVETIMQKENQGFCPYIQTYFLSV